MHLKYEAEDLQSTPSTKYVDVANMTASWEVCSNLFKAVTARVIGNVNSIFRYIRISEQTRPQVHSGFR